MRTRALAVGFTAVLAAAVPVRAQNGDAPLTKGQTAVACAISPGVLPLDKDAIRILGSQDTAVRTIFGPRDQLVIQGGASRHLQLGQTWFVRHAGWFGPESSAQPYAIATAGWLKIVAVNDTTAIGVVDYACGPIMLGDYLEPFAAPAVAADMDRPSAGGTLDFEHLGHVLYGDGLSWTAGIGGFMLVDRGADQGASVGSRFAVYRDLAQKGVPLASVGEVVVVSTGPSTSVVRVVDARDAVTTGDVVVPRK
ncbi:MAG TPA: hypothetical protein VL309_08670 [Vicinamibacterales bacterium]|nr:hypothetical protein [Vicinamibacterales bacterium]